MVSKILMISFILILAALLVYVIGFSTSHFIDIEQASSRSYHGGLWVRCETLHSKIDLTTCQDTAEFFNLGDRAWFKACRATSILGLIFLFVAIICAGLKLLAFKEKKDVLQAAIGMTFGAVVFILAAVIVFTQNVEEVAVGLPFDYGFSFALTIVGMCIAVIAGVFMVVECFTGVHE
ncbi:unnamed protein product [Mytilus coruscus]|uniref:CACNG5 n=1 Tax=Mytilus coruscus TaxID=42192 RepID=A0A6J8A355_MYTCO|nr:unnamed protein product [Mytilus coruscus]